MSKLSQKFLFQILAQSILVLLLIISKLGQLPIKLAILVTNLIIKPVGIRTISLCESLKHKAIVRLTHNLATSVPTQPKTKAQKKQSKKSRKKLYQGLKFRIAASAFIVFVVVYSAALINIAKELPSPDRLTTVQRPLTTQIYDRNGKLLYQVYEGRNRKLTTLDQLPQHLIDATISIEDKHFYTHPGIDFGGIVRAFKTNIEDNTMQGGSTITQQLIKNTLLTPDKTYTRKIKEVALSLWAESIYTKKEILTMYFNEVPYGGPAWGVEATSEMYFGKTARELNLAESTFLAGLPAAPTSYSPYGTSPEKGKERQMEVLRRMVDEGYISQTEADETYNQEIKFKPAMTDIKAPHFVMYVRSLLAEKYGQRTVSQGGLNVTTTLDLDTQEMAEKVVADQVEKLNKLRVSNGAAMVMDSGTGQILAMVGSKNYFDPKGGNFNVALSLRQPGSSIKPITYATAFKLGYGPGTMLLDAPTTFPNPWGKGYTPVNYDGRFHGLVSARTALGSSYNIPAVKMLAIVGIPAMVQTAKDLGITSFDSSESYGLSITLGGVGVRMIDMMTAYNTFASGGVKYQPSAILKVTDPNGNVLEDYRYPEGKKVLSEEVAYLISDVLSDNQARTPVFGPNSMLKIENKTVAVKTGTSDDKRDNWVFGYTPKYVVGTWVGNNDYSPMDPQLASGITGATPIWHDIMFNLVKDYPNLAFERPKGVIDVNQGTKKELAIYGLKPKEVAVSKVTKEKDNETGQEKEVVTYSDPFTFSFTPDILKQTNN